MQYWVGLSPDYTNAIQVCTIVKNSYIEGVSPFFWYPIELVGLGLGSFFKSSARLLRLAKKPGRSELWLTIKICSVGITAIGMIGYVVKILSAFIASSFPG